MLNKIDIYFFCKKCYASFVENMQLRLGIFCTNVSIEMYFVFLRNVRAPTLQSVKIICMQSFFVLHNNFLAVQTGTV